MEAEGHMNRKWGAERADCVHVTASRRRVGYGSEDATQEDARLGADNTRGTLNEGEEGLGMRVRVCF